jgi:Trk K+ transport system NAD-binding subunit
VRAIVVGARGATRDLLRRLSDRWHVIVVDTDANLLARAAEVRDVEVLLGDGSSKVVLDRAGVAEADALVAATLDDEVNLEACRIALGLAVHRVVAVAADPERITDYRELGVSVFAPDSLTARQIETSLEPRRVSSTTFAAGKAEAIEFRIADDSPVRGVTLKDLHSTSYLVAAISRGDRLIVPHGSTVLESGDLVTVVGATADFSQIVATFTAGEARFPLDFGRSVLLALSAGSDFDLLLGEALEVTRNSPADGLVLAHRNLAGGSGESEASDFDAVLEGVRDLAEGVDVRFQPVSGDPGKRITEVIRSESIGLVVVPAPPPERLGRFKVARLLRRTLAWGLPILFARGSHPYHRILSPARQTPSGKAAERAAIDLAGYGRASLIAVAVVTPAFVTGSDQREEAVRALARLREEAAVLDVPVRRLLRQGNPVRVIQEAAEDVNLVVLGAPRRRPTALAPGIVAHLLERVKASVLVVPPE